MKHEYLLCFQFLQQLSQLTCGAVTTISQSSARARTAPARTAQKIRFSSSTNGTSARAVASALTPTSNLQLNENEKVHSSAETSVLSNEVNKEIRGLDQLSAATLQSVLGKSEIDAKLLARNLSRSIDSVQLNQIVNKIASDIIIAATAKGQVGDVKTQDKLNPSVIENLKLEIFKVS